MAEQIGEPIDVIVIYKTRMREVSNGVKKWRGTAFPFKFKWMGIECQVTAVNTRSVFRDDDTLIHHYSVSTDNLICWLLHNTATLTWFLKEMEDSY